MKLMLILVLGMIMKICVVLVGVLSFPGDLAVRYTGFLYRGLNYHQFLLKLVYLLSQLLRYDVVSQDYCYFDYCLMTQFLRYIFYASVPGPCGGRCMNGGARIIRGISSCSGGCVCAPKFVIQFSLFSNLRFNW